MALARRRIILLIVIVVVSSLGAGAYLTLSRGDSSSADDPETEVVMGLATSASESFATDLAIPVEVAEVVRDTLVISVSASGQAAALRQTTIVAQVSGRVEGLYVKENDLVDPRVLLIEVDSTEYALEVARAIAGKRSAEATYRETTLFDDRVEDQRVREERDIVARAKSGLDAAEVALRKAELDLSRTRIYPPFSGHVASIEVVPGQWVSAGDELMTIIELDQIKVEVQVLEGEVGFLNRGRKARVEFAALPGEFFTGRVETVNPIIDDETRTAKVTVLLDNPGGRILPGMYARVSLEARHFPDRILVPRSAILERDRRTMLFVDEGGLAKWRYVTTGLENEELVEVVPHPETSMVEPGEFVLVRGHYSLTHDAAIAPVESVREAGGRRPD